MYGFVLATGAKTGPTLAKDFQHRVLHACALPAHHALGVTNEPFFPEFELLSKNATEGEPIYVRSLF